MKYDFNFGGLKNMKTQGQIDYEMDVESTPTYHDGTLRKQWSELSEIAQYSWNRCPKLY
jgi:hypothetical protein